MVTLRILLNVTALVELARDTNISKERNDSQSSGQLFPELFPTRPMRQQ
jgi:hypothetical protein